MGVPLAERLRRRIVRDGPIPVAEYMATCLGDPADGYYRRGDPLGAGGDFTTAPEISQMFGELLGLWSAELWRRQGCPDPVRLVELGPGRGSLMVDALRAIAAAMPGFRAALRLHLVESSPGLRAVQSERLAAAAPSWHATLDQVPPGPLVILANEFFDALPIRQFVRVAAGWAERLVDVGPNGEGFRFATGTTITPVDDLLSATVRAASIGAVAEACPSARAIVTEIARRVAAEGGGALIVDYGPAASAAGDSLQAVRHHRYYPVLASPGKADLTAHVDFASLLDAARAAGADGHGPLTQTTLLGRLGIEARLAKLMAAASADRRRALVAEFRRLTDDDRMGGMFKAISITPPGIVAPGFEP